MNFSFSDLIDLSKVPIKIFWLFTIVSGTLLFAPESFLEELKLKEFEQNYGMYFGIVLIVCVSFIILSLIYYMIKEVKSYFFRKRLIKQLNEKIKNLDPSEQSVLREFIVLNRTTVSMPMDHPVVSGLLNKSILIRKSNIGTGMYFPMAISRLAEKHLEEIHVGISEGMNEEKIIEVLSNRPDWADDFIYTSANK
ncbi:superinfection exclusion B family protein [Aquimarina spongiae]|uniref:Superinfection exclusion protein B n=1 Tax=Aquimarina spongiae TaxID=570521 RepID=A0A1M6JG65_9FLAO|nr:superinfection exclusion B family protein [Aquimarina spongiae]SHJ45655.1 Superinfection exclusion protein B [Aquimarina spongiae]